MDCNSEIMRLIESRMEKGRKEYGHGLVQGSGYDWLKISRFIFLPSLLSCVLERRLSVRIE